MRRLLCCAILGLAAVAMLVGRASAADPAKTPAAAVGKNAAKGARPTASSSEEAADDAKKPAADDPFASLDKPDVVKSAGPKKSSTNLNRIDLVEDAFALPKGILLRGNPLNSYNVLRKKYLTKVQDVVKRIEQPTSDDDKAKAARELRVLREQIRTELAPIIAMERKADQLEASRLQQQQMQQQLQLQQQMRRMRTPLYGN
jgi:hypothetical protein